MHGQSDQSLIASRAASLRQWIDRIAVAGKTFRYSADGRPDGLASDKRVIVAISRGGFYDDGNAMEHVETYLRGLLGFLGITPTFVHADGIAVGPEQREAGMANGLSEVVALAAKERSAPPRHDRVTDEVLAVALFAIGDGGEAERMEIERGHESGHRRATRLVAPDLEPVAG